MTRDGIEKFLERSWQAIYGEMLPATSEKIREPEWSYTDRTGVAYAMGDMYRAIEDTIRMCLEKIEGVRVEKSDEWHRDLIAKGREFGMIPDDLYKSLDGMRSFRHILVHGYTAFLSEDKIRENFPDAVATLNGVLNCIAAKYGFEEILKRVKK